MNETESLTQRFELGNPGLISDSRFDMLSLDISYDRAPKHSDLVGEVV